MKISQIFDIWPEKDQPGNPNFNLFLQLLGGGCVLSIYLCGPGIHTHLAYNVISAYLIVW